MSRSGYESDGENHSLWRASVERAIRGKRGQAFLRELVAALDAMPVKRLIMGEVVRDSEHMCALGSVAVLRKMDIEDLDIFDGEDVGKAFNIAQSMAREIVYENDKGGGSYDYEKHEWIGETSEVRWQRMRAWAVSNILGN